MANSGGSDGSQSGDTTVTDTIQDDWASRYGIHDQKPALFTDVNRSWLCPIFPNFGPTEAHSIAAFIGDGDQDFVNAPQGDAADQLFASESIQMERFSGLRTWEVMLFKNVKAYQDGNELVTHGNETRRLVVNEAEWCSVFKKNRWIDYCMKLKDSAIDKPRTYGGEDAIWSVDNPAVWEQLSPAIELANRILHQACHGSW